MCRSTCILVLLTAIVTCQHVTAVTSFSCVGKTLGFYANPDECAKYYICTGGADTTDVECASGLQFNTQTKFCDYPANVNCNGRHSSITQTPITQRPIVTMQPIVTTKTPNAITNAPVQTGRPSFTNPPQPTFLPPTNSPFTFAPLQTKAPSTYAPLQTAQPGVTFFKSTPSSITNAPATNTPLQTVRPGGIFFPLFTNPPQVTNAPNPTTGRPLTNAPVFPGSNICFGKIDGYFLDPKDCGYYYQCSFGQSVREPCPPRLVFNEKTNACDYAQNVPACSQYPLQGRK